MTDVPPAAIDVAVKAILEQHGIQRRIPPGDESAVWPIVWVALEAAAPHLAAAERETCARLAEQHQATGSKCAKGIAPNPARDCGCRACRPRFPFADLLRKDQP